MKRIQRQRTKGWRMPDGAIYVGRPSRWGNPFRAGTWEMDASMTGHIVTRAEAVQRFRDYRSHGIDLAPLRGATALCCWCPIDQPCHADVLIEMLGAA